MTDNTPRYEVTRWEPAHYRRWHSRVHLTLNVAEAGRAMQAIAAASTSLGRATLTSAEQHRREEANQWVRDNIG